MVSRGSVRRTGLAALFLLLAMLAGCTGHSAAAPAPADPMVKEQTANLGTDQVETYWNKLLQEYGGYFPDSQTPTFLQMLVPDSKKWSLSSILKGLLGFFFHEVLVNGKLLAMIVILTVFSMILETMQSAFENTTVSKVAYSISYMVLIVIAVNSFNVGIGYAKNSIADMTHFMFAMVPILLSLLASMGNIASVTVLHPLIVFMVHLIETAIYSIIFPLLFFSAVLHIVSSLTDRFKVTQLANLLRSIGVGLLGFIVTVFLGVVSVEGASGAVTDGVTIRTAKYITGNFVPVVGRMFSDASETVIGASLLVKNAVGLVGIFILILLCAFPAIKILTIALIYQLAAAVMQPLGDSPIVSCLQTIGRSLIYVFAALAATGLMFFLAITMIITAGNLSVMIR